MHDIDRTVLETELESDGLEVDESELSDDTELFEATDLESPFDDVEEMEMALELLSVSSDEELEQFLGKLLKGAWRGIGKVGKTIRRVARPLGGVLKAVAKKALPVVGGALGSFVPIPGVGTAIGTAAGSLVSNALEAELEEFDSEDREIEGARRLVRVVGGAARQAALTRPDVDPVAAARAATMAAARRHLPQLSQVPTSQQPTGLPGISHSGRWVRRGRKICLLGA
jgi:hypothetical protein